jgi:hypothetical protein
VFLEKFSRFYRRYDLHLSPRHKAAERLPMIAPVGQYSVLDAIRVAQKAGKASSVQPNGDTVELIMAEVREPQKVAILLFHRSSPDAADPMYRKKVKDKLSVRQAEKANGEEQTVSAHLVIELEPKKPGAFRAALEEIPGISLAVIQAILSPILRDYSYGFQDKKGDDHETYSTLKVEGIKSEALSDALKTQTLNYLTLTRTTVPNAPDGDGIVEPMNDRMRYKIVGNPSDPAWTTKLDKWVKKVRGEGWEDISLDISLDDERHRTVKLDRDQEAKEMLFVRSEQVSVKTELKPCTTAVLDEMVEQAIAIIKKIP